MDETAVDNNYGPDRRIQITYVHHVAPQIMKTGVRRIYLLHELCLRSTKLWLPTSQLFLPVSKMDISYLHTLVIVI